MLILVIGFAALGFCDRPKRICEGVRMSRTRCLLRSSSRVILCKDDQSRSSGIHMNDCSDHLSERLRQPRSSPCRDSVFSFPPEGLSSSGVCAPVHSSESKPLSLKCGCDYNRFTNYTFKQPLSFNHNKHDFHPSGNLCYFRPLNTWVAGTRGP